jgi:hypothetical protein
MRCFGMDLEVQAFYNTEGRFRHIAGYPRVGAAFEAAALAAHLIRRKGFN